MLSIALTQLSSKLDLVRVRSPRFRHWARIIRSFLAGQGSIQTLNIMTGFFLLRWMSVESYAQFSIAFSFQTTMQWLLDLGLTGSIINLVGDRKKDVKVLGRYIRSASYFRSRLFVLVVPSAITAFPLLTARHNWSLTTTGLLLTSIVIALFFQGWASIYSTPFLIKQDINRYYQPQTFSAVLRLILSFVLYSMSALTSWTYAIVSSIAIAYQGVFYKSRARNHAALPRHVDESINSEITHYLAPFIPWVIFTAFQGQISILIITLLGKTRNIAEVAALGRLNQIFLAFGAFAYVVIAPYIAQIVRKDLLKRYLQIITGAAVISMMFSASAFIFPQIYLWILGEKYQNLQIEVGWSIVISSMSCISTLMMTMHNARKWVYWWWSVAHIGGMVLTQLLCLTFMDLSTTLGIVYFSVISSAVALLFLIAVGIYGFIFGPPRKLTRA